MATVHEDHIIERDGSGSSAGMWALAIIVVVAVLLLLFRFGAFGRSSGSSNGTNINGTVNTPSGTYQGSGTVTQ